MSNVLLMGGGFDSYAVALKLAFENKPFKPVHIDYEQVSCMSEREACFKQINYINSLNKTQNNTLTIVNDLNFIVRSLNPSGSYLFGDTEAPPELSGRNFVLFLLALTITPANSTLYLGLDKPYKGAKPFKDCTLKYFETVLDIVDRKDIKIEAPFILWEKEDTIRWILNKDAQAFSRTVSCWNATYENNSAIECGKCKHCITKNELKDRLNVHN